MNEPLSSVDISRVVRAEIHPAIGVGRVGNSEEEYYLTPEVPNPASKPPNSYRDSSGAIKREAVRFRIYGYDENDEVVAELTQENAEVEWQAHIANLKSAWYEFSVALDISQAKDEKMPRRNPSITAPEDRAALVIDPGMLKISGESQEGADTYLFDTGTFMGEKVYLGELRTDEKGRLIVLGGRGNSNSPSGMPAFNPKQNNGFGNALEWHDDTSDGPVDATVTIDGKSIPVEGAWVAFGPPKYAPDIIGWRSMYEMLEQVFIANGSMKQDAEVSFTKHVYPILQRMTNLQWVNSGFASMFGSDGPLNFENPELIDKLSRQHGERDAYAVLRREIYNAFRPSENNPGANPRSWPWIYGDAFGSYDQTSAEVYLQLPNLYQTILEAWKNGKFVADWPATSSEPTTIDQVCLADQPSTLTKASLHYCAADAFHPGIELTWPMRHFSMYSSNFRIRRNDGSLPKLDYGEYLTQEIALSSVGPLHAQGPGGLTRWMLVPWQVDTAGCRSGYPKGDQIYDPMIPTFWPAHVPNQVLTEEDYLVVMDASKCSDERRNAYNHRESWYASMPTQNSTEQLTEMVTYFGKMGIIEARPGPEDLKGVPDTIYVQTLPEAMEKHLNAAKGLLGSGLKSTLSAKELSGDEHKEMFSNRFGKSE